MVTQIEAYVPAVETRLQLNGPATLAEVMVEVDQQILLGEQSRFQALGTGFTPLDDVLNGGLRPGELMIVGGAFGVGKTIFALQVARNAVCHDRDAAAMYICYEHDRSHLMQRLLCLESAELGHQDSALNLRRLAALALEAGRGEGLVSKLRANPRYAETLAVMERYADRLVLVKASGSTSTLAEISAWAQDLADRGSKPLLVVDYLQKIPVDYTTLEPETETTTHLTQGLKELAMATGLRVLAIAASDRTGLKARRMRLADLRGSSALQYEADIGIVLNNKYEIVSREHMVYNLSQAESMRSYVILSVEKNRAGRNAVDIEYMLDAAHFRMLTSGGYVRERLIDEKVTLA